MSKSLKGHQLRQYLAQIQRWSLFIVLCTVLAALGGFVVSKIQRPLYEATAILVVDQQALGSNTGATTIDELVATYVNLIPQRVVLERAVTGISGVSATQLAGQLHVSSQTGSQLIQVQVDDRSPVRAARLANNVADAFVAVEFQSAQQGLASMQRQLDERVAEVTSTIQSLTEQINALQGQDPTNATLDDLHQQLDAANAQRAALQNLRTQAVAQYISATNNIRIFQRAVVPTRPVQPQPLLNILEGGVLGFVIALGVVFVWLALDDHVRTLDNAAELTGFVPLGTIPVAREGKRRGLWRRTEQSTEQSTKLAGTLLTAGGNAYLTERFGIVRTNLRFASPSKPLRSILVTSPTPGDVKTTTAINLAASLAQSGNRVMLLDADFRRPTVHTRLGIDNKHGLSMCLLEDNLGGAYDVPCVTVPAVPNLYVLPAGPLPPNPTELLGSDRMLQFKRSVLADGRQHRSVVDMVVFDSPPVLTVADALVLAGQVDGTILVVDAARARVGEVLRARDNLQRASNGLLGVVLFSVGRDEERYYYPSNNIDHDIAVAQRDESIDNPDVLETDTAAQIRQ